MIEKNKLTVILLILILTLIPTSITAQTEIIEDLNFRNANIVDVLRAIAEVADVNLITDSNINGNITVNLKNITFEKALDLITQTRAIDYRWDGNTVVVAETERLDSIYADIVTEFLKVESSDFDNIGTIVKELFPETQITLDAPRRQFIIKGERENVEEIKTMVQQLDEDKTVTEIEAERRVRTFEEEEIELYTLSYQILNAEAEDLRSKLETVNPDIQVNVNPLTDTLTLTGVEQDVKEVISMAQSYDQSLEPETRNIRVDYVDTEQITEIVGNFYPDIKLHVNTKRKEIIINGAKNKLDGVEQLIREINQPQHQVVIEIRLEEIATDELKERGIDLDLSGNSLSRIHFIKDSADPSFSDVAGGEFGQIQGIELTWPNFLRMINDDSLSKTLANPRLMTLNGEEANMSILDEVPYPIRDEDGQISTYDYMEAGIELTFTPWITENDEIELKMTPEVSSFGTRREDMELPPKKTRSVDTRLRLQDGETIAIGGLIQEDEREAMSKIPLLGDIPIIGQLFSSSSTESSRTELLIFVTPRILKYGEEYTGEEHLITSGLEEPQADMPQIEAGRGRNVKTEADVIAEYLEERARSREEILAALRSDKEQETKEFNELSPEELENILNK